MTLRSSLVLRLRWVVLVLPLFALFSTAQVGCGSDDDDFSREDLKAGGPNGGYGYGTYGNYDDNDGDDTGYGYGYE